MTTRDPASYVHDLAATWNAHDMDGALSFFAPDATVQLTPPPPQPLPGVFRGRDAILGLVKALMPDFHVEVRDAQGTGERITWSWTATGDRLRAMGADPAEGSADARLAGDAIMALELALSPQAAQQMQRAAAPHHRAG